MKTDRCFFYIIGNLSFPIMKKRSAKMRTKFQKYSQKALTYELERANIYANKISKTFACDRRKQNVY